MISLLFIELIFWPNMVLGKPNPFIFLIISSNFNSTRMPPKKLSDSDVCKNPNLKTCAHEPSRALENLGYKITGCVGNDTCERPIRAK